MKIVLRTKTLSFSNILYVREGLYIFLLLGQTVCHEVIKIKVFTFLCIFLGDDIKKPEKLCKHDLQYVQENCGRQKQSPGSSRIVNAIRKLNSQKNKDNPAIRTKLGENIFLVVETLEEDFYLRLSLITQF